jgi:hypothetical protein
MQENAESMGKTIKIQNKKNSILESSPVSLRER